MFPRRRQNVGVAARKQTSHAMCVIHLAAFHNDVTMCIHTRHCCFHISFLTDMMHLILKPTADNQVGGRFLEIDTLTEMKEIMHHQQARHVVYIMCSMCNLFHEQS